MRGWLTTQLLMMSFQFAIFSFWMVGTEWKTMCLRLAKNRAEQTPIGIELVSKNGFMKNSKVPCLFIT